MYIQNGFLVQARRCATCIYRKDSTLDLAKLEADVADRFGRFKGYRICHHSKDVCCRGFWDRHKDEFAAGQIAQRLDLVRFVHVDTLPTTAQRACRNPRRRASVHPRGEP